MQAFAALVGGGTTLSTCTCSVRELVRGPRWASDEQVAAVDRRGAELDDDLAGAGDGVVDLLEAEGAALADDHCLHGSDRMALSAPGASGGGGAGLRPVGADAGQGRSVSGERLDAEVAALRVRIVPRPRVAGRAREGRASGRRR